jgi:hypothetical protein
MGFKPVGLGGRERLRPFVGADASGFKPGADKTAVSPPAGPPEGPLRGQPFCSRLHSCPRFLLERRILYSNPGAAPDPAFGRLFKIVQSACVDGGVHTGLHGWIPKPG